MTEVELYRPPAAELAIPDQRDTDSWIAVCSDVIKVANVIHDTPFVPEGLRGSAPAVAAAILAGRELGIGPMTALQHIHVIKGKPAQSAALMRALIQSKGHKWEDGEVTDTRAVVRGCRKGESKWAEVTFTADQAKRAGIDLGKYPADKLYARATSRLARRKFADVVAGMPYSAEDLEDGDTGEDTVTETATAPAPEPKTRTARRAATRKQPSNEAAKQEDTPQEPSSDSGPPQPPLPGEDDPSERDYDSPNTVTPQQLTKLAVVFGSLGFGRDKRADRLNVSSKIIGRDIESANDLSKTEAGTLIDTLERCGTEERLGVLLATGEIPEATDG